MKVPDQQDQQIESWATAAWALTTVDRIDDPDGFVAECAAAPGALAFGLTIEKARNEMRTVLLDWAKLRIERGYDLPHISETIPAATI